MFRHGIITLLILSFIGITEAQTVFKMSNALTKNCQGKLKDSEAGPGGLTYGNNENFTFRICSGGKITMTFNSPFCVEAIFDKLRLFNGPDTNSPLLGTFSGNTVPPTIIATSGCLTVHFKSDANTAYCGWDADWTTEKVPPVPPIMTISPIPSCSTNTVKINFSKYVRCDSVLPNDFMLTGPVTGIIVNSITSTPACLSPGDTANSFTLNLNKSLSQNCYYKVVVDLGLPDNCDSIWHFILVDSFLINNCPFTVTVNLAPDTICPGVCSNISASLSGNGANCLTYNYIWNNGLPNSAGPHTVCINTPTNYTVNYSVNVQRTTGGPIVNGNKTLVYVNPKINFPNPTVVCQSDPPFNITVNNSGGRFAGPGITNTTLGTFNPNAAGPGSHYVKYGFTNFCFDSILIVVKPIDAGLNQAACPGTAPFMVSAFSPPGGTWTGSFITPAGIFNPAFSGVYTLTYTFNGCTDTKIITVDSIVLNTPVDTVCQSDTAFIISVSPPGGRWSGIGITDSILGYFNPQASGFGTKNLTYKLNGCNFTMKIVVNQISAGNDITVCPRQPVFVIIPGGLPGGGKWSGLGIVNQFIGLYNPMSAFGGGTGNDTLTYTHPNGCKDKKVVFLRNTTVTKDTVKFCLTDPPFELDFINVGRSPAGGVWTGPSVTNSGSRYYFVPTNAGKGVFKLFYTANTCKDSIVMVVYPSIIKLDPFNIAYPDTFVCSTHPSWNFPTMPPGGNWVGTGITNNKLGTFNPGVAQIGTHSIKYVTPNGCPDDSVNVTVYQFVPAEILNLDSLYCYKDTIIPIILKPANGKLTGAGIDSLKRFNPSLAGQGIHTLTYTYGHGFCKTSDSLFVTISPEISTDVSVTDSALCPGENTTITVHTNGGTTGAIYTYAWNEGLFPINEQTVSPKNSTLYVVTTSDGCSYEVIDSIYIAVSNKVVADFETSEIRCFGVEGYIKIIPRDSSNYDVTWHTDPEQKTDSILGYAGNGYRVTLTDLQSGCILDTTGRVPGYKNIVSKFITSPSYECIPSDQKTITFLDLSFNADSGNWDIAGLQQIPYQVGINPQYTFTEAGYYKVTLTVFNIGGCNDEFSTELCVEDIRPIFVADAFSPNGDGINDVLHVKTQGVKELTFQIFDRWGHLVFESNHVDHGWDGRIAGKEANPGVYIYLVQSKNLNNEVTLEKGNVTLVR